MFALATTAFASGTFFAAPQPVFGAPVIYCPVMPAVPTIVPMATVVAFVPSVPPMEKRHNGDGVYNIGSPLFIPKGVAVADAIPPPIHLRPVEDVEGCSVTVSPSSRSSTPDPREFDGFLNVAEPLFIAPESANIDFSTPAASSSAGSSAPAASASTDGVLNIQPPLFVAPGVEFRPSAAIPSTEGAARAPKAAPKPPTPTPEPKKPKAAEHNGVLNIQEPLFVPSEEERKKAEQIAAEKFWAKYWEKEEKRLEMLANSIFPEPLPRPPPEDDEDKSAVKAKPPKTNADYSSHMPALMESLAAFIGI